MSVNFKNIISIRDLKKAELDYLVETAADIESGRIKPDMSGKIAALLFFEPSTRTSFSFESAMKRMGGEALLMKGTGGTSVKKGESFADTLRTIERYSDIIVIRHAIEGAARFASEVVGLPVVNAGDGANQHPTQALLDLYSIKKTQGRLDNLKIGLVGDLRFGRTVHSLAQALSSYNPEFYFISPDFLKMPEHIKADLDERGINYTEVPDVEDVTPELDIMYVTRVQRERFVDPEDYERLKGSYIITPDTIKNAKENMKILHPLPRVDEIVEEVDSSAHAYYFEQAENGVYMRQAILSILTGGIK
ncbi:MAG: aspartate carbamoyltransferase [Acidobacteria bacterium]|nr:MAG: aspartate carbamoyltransferase [Acidobacteriota bacterium]